MVSSEDSDKVSGEASSEDSDEDWRAAFRAHTKAGARRQVVPAGDAWAKLVLDFDGAGRAVFGCLLNALFGPFGNNVDLGLGHVAVDFEDVRAGADAQLAAGAQLFIDRCFHSDLHSRPAGNARPAQFILFRAEI